MNWETYKLLTPEQKEEFKFRFDKDITVNIKGLATVISLMLAMVTLLLFIVYLCVIDPKFAAYKDSIVELIVRCRELIFVSGIIILGYLIEYTFELVVHMYQYRKWIKRNNIRVIYWWKNLHRK